MLCGLFSFPSISVFIICSLLIHHLFSTSPLFFFPIPIEISDSTADNNTLNDEAFLIEDVGDGIDQFSFVLFESAGKVLQVHHLHLTVYENYEISLSKYEISNSIFWLRNIAASFVVSKLTY